MVRYFILVLGLVSQLLAFDHGFEEYNSFLGKYVDKGLVDYSSIKAGDELSHLTKKFEKLDKKLYDSFTENQRLAYLINTYNLFTIKLIVDNYPVKSIKKVAFKPWDKKIITLWGEKVSLNNIEHNTIRKKFKEPRIHFALVCAAKGCPLLQNYAFKASILDEQLSKVGLHFLNDTNKNIISSGEKAIQLSKIFKWYGSDFDNNYGSYLKYISKVTGKTLKSSVKVNWLDYNWELNSK